MIYLRTRSFARDYEYFSKEQPDFSWLKKYDDCKLYSEKDNNIFVEANGNYFNALLGRFIGEREDKFSRIIGYEIYVAGKTNSFEAQFTLALILYLLQDTNVKKRFLEIGKTLDAYFTKDFVESLDNCRNTPETQKLVQEKLQNFYNDVLANKFDIQNDELLPDNKFTFASATISKREEFKKIAASVLGNQDETAAQSLPNKFVLGFTDIILEQKFCDAFVENIKNASSVGDNICGMIITSNTNTNYISLPYEVDLSMKKEFASVNESEFLNDSNIVSVLLERVWEKIQNLCRPEIRELLKAFIKLLRTKSDNNEAIKYVTEYIKSVTDK